jgi:AraC-like DNA-binding protein
MEFKYLDRDKRHPLIDHFYQFKVTTEDIPFETPILPTGQCIISFIFSEENQICVHKKNKTYYKNLILTGQFHGSFNVSIPKECYTIGFSLRPTTLYKITNKSVSDFTNKQDNLEKFSEELHNKLNPLFIKYKDDVVKLKASIYKVFDTAILSNDKNVEHIDKAIDLIIEKDGLIRVTDILKEIPYSQKTLEVQFKKIVGLTPGKYMRQYRFMKLMQKYQSHKIDLKDLIYMYNYYDASHFAKDFKLFMNQNYKSFFKEEHPLIKRYLKE